MRVKLSQNERTLGYLRKSFIISSLLCLTTIIALLIQILRPQSVELVGIEEILKAQELITKDKIQEELKSNQFFPLDTLIKNDHIKASIVD